MKKLMLAVLFAAISTIALAQAPAAPPPPKTTLEFDQAQLQLLGQALMFLPKKDADPFLADLNGQIAVQQKAAVEKQKLEAEKQKAAAANAEKKPEPAKPESAKPKAEEKWH